MAKTTRNETQSAETCCPPTPEDTKGRSGWLMAIPVIGVFLCCGGPVIGAWLASAGLLAVIGSWWSGVGHWLILGIAVVVSGGGSWWWSRNRRLRSRETTGRADA